MVAPPVAAPSDHEILAALCRGLGASGRIAVINALRDGEKTMDDIIIASGVPGIVVKTHVKWLCTRALVKTTFRGGTVYYSIRHAEVIVLLRTMDKLLARVRQAHALAPSSEP